MKKILFFSVFIFCFSFSKAQGNLQFNQAILLEPIHGTPLAFSVPVGKVWKIESKGVAQSSCYLQLQNSASVGIAYLYSNGGANEADMPLWLPSGYSGFFSVTNCSPQKGMISIIEFNVIP